MTSLLMQATPEKRIVMTKPLESSNLQLDVDLNQDYVDLNKVSTMQALEQKLQTEQKISEFYRNSAFEKSSDRMSPAYQL